MIEVVSCTSVFFFFFFPPRKLYVAYVAKTQRVGELRIMKLFFGEFLW